MRNTFKTGFAAVGLLLTSYSAHSEEKKPVSFTAAPKIIESCVQDTLVDYFDRQNEVQTTILERTKERIDSNIRELRAYVQDLPNGNEKGADSQKIGEFETSSILLEGVMARPRDKLVPSDVTISYRDISNRKPDTGADYLEKDIAGKFNKTLSFMFYENGRYVFPLISAFALGVTFNGTDVISTLSLPIRTTDQLTVIENDKVSYKSIKDLYAKDMNTGAPGRPARSRECKSLTVKV